MAEVTDSRRYIPDGALVARVLESTDVDKSLGDGTDLMQLLQDSGAGLKANVARDHVALVEQARRALVEAETSWASEQARVRELNEKNAHGIRFSRSWTLVGIHRYLPPMLPLPVRIVMLLFFAGADFYIFAYAVSVLQNTEQSLTNPEFLGGGLLGLAVFSIGLYVAHAVKHTYAAWMQRRLLKKIDAGDSELATGVDRKSLELSPAFDGWATAASLLFLALVLGAYLIRRDATIAGQGAEYLLYIQSALPLVGALVEFFGHDPFGEQPTRPKPSAQTYESRIRMAEDEVSAAAVAATEAVDKVEGEVAEERDKLASLLKDKGFRVL